LEVVEEFGDATEAAESGVSGAGTVGEDASFEDKDIEVWRLRFEAEGGAEPDDSAADYGNIDIAEIGVFLPVT
jgi:uncharacterized protein (DUF433 family)